MTNCWTTPKTNRLIHILSKAECNYSDKGSYIQFSNNTTDFECSFDHEELKHVIQMIEKDPDCNNGLLDNNHFKSIEVPNTYEHLLRFLIYYRIIPLYLNFRMLLRGLYSLEAQSVIESILVEQDLVYCIKPELMLMFEIKSNSNEFYDRSILVNTTFEPDAECIKRICVSIEFAKYINYRGAFTQRPLRIKTKKALIEALFNITI